VDLYIQKASLGKAKVFGIKPYTDYYSAAMMLDRRRKKKKRTLIV